MAEKGEPLFYSPLPPQPNNQSDVILYPYRPPGRRLRRVFFVSVFIFLLSAAIFFLWPSDPDLTVVRLNLEQIQVHTSPKISIDISLFLTLRVRNRDFFSLEYSSLDVSIGYRGRGLGTVNSTGGILRARASSYVNAKIELDGVEVIHDVFYLLHDLAKGSIPFDTDTVARGKLGLLFFEVPLKAKVSCGIDVNTNNQTIIRQDCYPELLCGILINGNVCYPVCGGAALESYG